MYVSDVNGVFATGCRLPFIYLISHMFAVYLESKSTAEKTLL